MPTALPGSVGRVTLDATTASRLLLVKVLDGYRSLRLTRSALKGRFGGADRSATGGDADEDGVKGVLARWAPVIHDFKIRSDVLLHAAQGGGAGDGGVTTPTGDAVSATASFCFSHLRAVV